MYVVPSVVISDGGKTPNSSYIKHFGVFEFVCLLFNFVTSVHCQDESQLKVQNKVTEPRYFFRVEYDKIIQEGWHKSAGYVFLKL